jgi:hypothetical protein
LKKGVHSLKSFIISISFFTSPLVGNWKWRFAFQELERQKRLQHLRIQNAEDMVTLMPFAAPRAGFLSPVIAVKTGAGNLYKHVGMRLQLTQSSKGTALPYHISYPVDQRMDDEEFAKDVQDTLSQGKSLMQAFKAVVTNNFERVERYHRYVANPPPCCVVCKKLLSSNKLLCQCCVPVVAQNTRND